MAVNGLFDFKLSSNLNLTIGYEKKGRLWTFGTKCVGGYELVSKWL